MTNLPEYPVRYNAARGLLDFQTLGIDPSKPAFRSAAGDISFLELQAQSAAIGPLLSDLGLQVEQRVAMLVHDCPLFPVFFLGAINSGRIPIPLNTLLTAEQYRFILQDAGVRAVCVSAALLPLLEPVLDDIPDIKTVIVCGGEAGQHLSLEQELQKRGNTVTEPLSDAESGGSFDSHRDSTAFWLYSSGSTGTPKGVRHLQTSMMDTAQLYGRNILGLTSEDVVYSAAKLFFAYGLGNALSFPLSVGATAVLDAGRPTPAAVMENLRTYQPSVFFGAPTLFAAMLADDECHPDNGSARLRLCVSAGEALPKDIGERWKARFGCDIVDGVGSTEMLHIFLSNSPQQIHYGTSGVPVPGYDVRLVDEHDQLVADEEIGELLVKGTTAAEGYWNQREKSRNTFVGNWTRTGDKYTRSAQGLYTYSGRTDDMFKVSGQWVSPFEVESALISHPSVIEAAVVPWQDDEDLLKPKAFVILQEGETLNYDELKSHVQAAVGKWKYPRWIESVTELPKTATGKIQRFKLRQKA